MLHTLIVMRHLLNSMRQNTTPERLTHQVKLIVFDATLKVDC